jgi:hypothetical protein
VGENALDLFRLEVPCDRDAPCVVREAIGRCDELGSVREDARLLASELVTSAVVQSGCDSEHTLEVSASLEDDRLLISVNDPRPSFMGSAASKAAGVSSYGMRVIEIVARSWGLDRPDGQRLWAELAI